MIKSNDRLRKQKLFLFFLLTWIGIAFEGYSQISQSNNKSEAIILQLRWFHQFQFAGYYAAVEKGYYRDVGLNVIIKEAKLGLDTIEEVIKGRVQFGIGGSNLLLHRNEGKPVVMLANIFQHSPLIILSRSKSRILSPQDLIGKRVMIRKLDEAETPSMILNEGISLEKVEFVEHTYDYNDLINGKVDAASAFITTQPFLLKEKRIAFNFLRPLTYGIDFYGDCLFTSEEEIRKHPKRVKAFREASIKGWTYAMKHKEELITLIKTKYRSKVSTARLRYEAESMEQIIVPKLVEIGHINPGRWQHIAETYAQVNMLEKPYSLDGFIYDPNPRPDLVRIYWIIGIVVGISVIIGVVSLALFRFNRRLQKEISERKQAEEKLTESRDYLERLTNSMWDVVFSIKMPERVIEWVNDSFKHFGYEHRECIGKDTAFLYANKDHFLDFGSKLQDAIIAGKDVLHSNHLLRRKSGETFPAETTVTFHRENDEVVSITSIVRDITERKNAEEQIKISLKEKETLLQEIHHRVKNNMQIISSLLKLQANVINDERVTTALTDSWNRIQAMSTIHEILYQSENLTSINMNVYLSKLVKIVFQNYTISRQISLNLKAEDVLVGVKRASPVGLIVNELISNSLKYAFPDNQKGEVKISLQKTENQIELEYADNGIGIPEDFDWYNTKSMGLNLVKLLAESQLDGSIDMERNNGTKFTIKFNIKTQGT